MREGAGEEDLAVTKDTQGSVHADCRRFSSIMHGPGFAAREGVCQRVKVAQYQTHREWGEARVSRINTPSTTM